MLLMWSIDSLGKWPLSTAQNEKKKRDNPTVSLLFYRVKKTLEQARAFPAKHSLEHPSKLLEKPKVIGPLPGYKLSAP